MLQKTNNYAERQVKTAVECFRRRTFREMQIMPRAVSRFFKMRFGRHKIKRAAFDATPLYGFLDESPNFIRFLDHLGKFLEVK
jgi:hypothetical protein